jgi:hypothetical protein
MSVSEELVELLLATRFWPNLVKDRELQVRGEDGFVVVSYGGEDLFLFGCNAGRLTCRTRPRLVPVHPEVFSQRSPDAWLQLRVTAAGTAVFEASPELIELGDACPEVLSAYKESVKRGGLWDRQRLSVEVASDPCNRILVSQIGVPGQSRVADFAIRVGETSEAFLLQLIDVSCLAPPIDWFVDAVRRNAALIIAFQNDLLISINQAVELQRRLRVARVCEEPATSIDRLQLQPIIGIGNCTTAQASSIAKKEGAWKWIADTEVGKLCRIRPYWKQFNPTEA